jgi:hypothetical protein
MTKFRMLAWSRDRIGVLGFVSGGYKAGSLVEFTGCA